MTDRTLKITFGLISLLLLATLVYKLTAIPGGMILPGWFLGGMLLVGVIIVGLVLTGLLKLLFKKTSFLALFFIVSTAAFSFLHYYFYSPKLKITIPNGYCGQISLVKSNASNNVLTVDSNGIGYLTKWTFDKLYLKPTVIQQDGKNIDKNLVGFNPSTFFGIRKSCCIEGQEIESLSFEIVPDSVIGQKQYYSKSLLNLVDKKLIALSKKGKYTTADTVTIDINKAK
jgi:hypothetical protein